MMDPIDEDKGKAGHVKIESVDRTTGTITVWDAEAVTSWDTLFNGVEVHWTRKGDTWRASGWKDGMPSWSAFAYPLDGDRPEAEYHWHFSNLDLDEPKNEAEGVASWWAEALVRCNMVMWAMWSPTP